MNGKASKSEFKGQKCPKCSGPMETVESVEEVSLFQQTARIEKKCKKCGTEMTSKFSERTLACPDCGASLDYGFVGENGVFQLVFNCMACQDAVFNQKEVSE